MDGFASFDLIRYVRPVEESHIWDRMQERFRKLGIAGRVEPVPAMPTPADGRIGVVLSHRRIVQEASEQGAQSVLVFSGDVHFLDRTADILPEAVAELAHLEWTLCYLGGWWPTVLEREPGCRHLNQARDLSDAHAVAYSSRVYSRILADWPAEAAELAGWVDQNDGIDGYLGKIEHAAVVHPVITTVPALLPFEAADMQWRFTI